MRFLFPPTVPAVPFALVTLALVLGACTTRSPAPVEERPTPGARVLPSTMPSQAGAGTAETDWRPPTYTVKRGDTLHAIALEHGLDYRELAALNGIDNPNRIHVGQVLRIPVPPPPQPVAAVEVSPAPEPPMGVVTAPLRGAGAIESRPGMPADPGSPDATASTGNTELLKVSPRAVKEPYSAKLAQEMAKAPPDTVVARADPSRSPAAPPPVAQPGKPAAPESPASKPGSGSGELDWTWPARGRILTGFSETATLKGIDIAGTAGQPVLASAPGRVVYAGTGLRGYGKLVIIKHNPTFLSAYAHNREILVKEGQDVTRGQQIAEMGSTDTDQVKLHFEIRRLGRPMDPLKFLPPG